MERPAMNDTDKCSEYITLLKENKNLILTGAPGTGKTYLTREIAKAMNAECEFVQFHPSYDYTDFVEGLRPTAPDRNGNVGFERKDGVFKELCKRAIGTLKSVPRKKLSNDILAISGNVKDKTFESIYNSIVSDIKSGKIQSYPNRRGDFYPLKINEKGRIEYRAKSPRTEKEENISKMYHYLIEHNIYDLSSWDRDDYWDLISKLSQSTKTIDYVEYGWILQELLNRTKVISSGSMETVRLLENNTSTARNDTLQFACDNERNINKNDEICNKPFVFIIDEINRGEISKIFGELFFSIDPGYRGEKGKVKTQYQNMITDTSDPFINGFYVPDNVYIIGTMNDIDRSVESMDFAMRRRFAWKEIKAGENTRMLDCLEILKDELIETMNRLNNAIWNEDTNEGIDGLNSAYHIGGAYFRKMRHYINDDYSNKEEAYLQLWSNHLRGLLFEYLRGSAGAAENLRMLEKVYFGGSIND